MSRGMTTTKCRGDHARSWQVADRLIALAWRDPADPVGFRAQQPIPATITLNLSEDGRNARLTPVYNHYRPKVVFGATRLTVREGKDVGYVDVRLPPVAGETL